MEVFDNINNIIKDTLNFEIIKGSRLSIATVFFLQIYMGNLN